MFVFYVWINTTPEPKMDIDSSIFILKFYKIRNFSGRLEHM